ncbi:MAG: hypothetical protein HC886_05935 [Leptolyngbyaceae cyanobacterium SM1_1_3]|nr:hypothetical protein [Leptolyngbyaceae cyanobacterium SM1_1_3]
MKIVNFLAIATTVAILGGFIIYLVFISFANGFGNGLRSLAATILPIIVLTYVGKYSQLFRSEHRAPLFNVFFYLCGLERYLNDAGKAAAFRVFSYC